MRFSTLLLFIFSTTVLLCQVSELPVEKVINDSIYKAPEIMPTFPYNENECDDAPKDCATQAMLNYIYGNIRYPDEAIEAGTEGMAVVSFVVEKHGSISDPNIYRDPGEGMGEEALRVVKAMTTYGITWTPGQNEGKKVRTHFMLPVKFALTQKSKKAAKKRKKRLKKSNHP